MSLTQYITEALHQYTYQPEIVYLLVVVIMLLSSFGLPLPEEAIIITTSLLAYMALNPDIYPPPEPGARGINVYVLMVVCFFAVFLSDLLVFNIGRRVGRNLKERKWFRNIIKPQSYRKIQFWTAKYGAAAAGLFRFLPGLRFPGHMACGALGIPTWKFVAVDFTVVLLTIPPQVYFIAHYGEEILSFFKKFRYVLIVVALLFVCYLLWLVFSNMAYVKKRKMARASGKQQLRQNKS